jgi:hypothetical protein
VDEFARVDGGATGLFEAVFIGTETLAEKTLRNLSRAEKNLIATARRLFVVHAHRGSLLTFT